MITTPTGRRVDAAEQEAVEAAWEETIDRRLYELACGSVAPVSGRETRELGRALLDQLRQRARRD